MSKRPMYGKTFRGGSVESYGPGSFNRIRVTRAPKQQETKTEHLQRRSVKAREKKGLQPSLPRFSWDEPLPEPPPPPSHEDVLRKLELQLEGCKAEGIEQETATHLIVAMLNKDGKPFTACWQKALGHITWLEGRHKPNKRLRNGPPRRKDIS